MAASETLEFRGMNRQQLGMYLEELGAVQSTDAFPFLYKSSDWSAEILKENIISLSSAFKVTSVLIQFAADDREILQQLLKKFRLKAFRIGG